MKIDTRLFRSILARRFFALFVVSALVPIVILASVAYRRVSEELFKQSEYRLHHAARSVGLSISERLSFLEAELGSFSILEELGGAHRPAHDATVERIQTLFDAVAIFSADGEVSPFFGEPPAPPKLDIEQLRHLELGKTLIITGGQSGNGRPSLMMARFRDPSDARAGLVVGVVSENYLWGISDGNVVPFGIELCAYDDTRRLLYGSFPGCEEMAPLVAAATVGGHNGALEVTYDREDFVARYRNLFLRPQFFVEDWTFVLVQSETEILDPMGTILSPMESFQWEFPLVALASLWVVLLLSSYAIRKSLVPLDRLTQATRRIAGRDFSTRVDVTSGDEFEDLADAFNTMSDRLQRQFKALATNAEIHRAILSTIDTSSIVETAAIGALDALDCDLVWVGVRGVGDSSEVDVSCADTRDPGSARGFSAALSDWDLEVLSSDEKAVVLTGNAGRSGLLECLAVEDATTVVALPVLLTDRLAAVLCVGRGAGGGFSDDELAEARQLADQIAVALSNSNLIDELKALTWGTLEALARAIDAKSSWTGGHSERVTALSLKIAKVMGRSESELEILHRGALLHDIGKLGVSMRVLDKPEQLSRDEYLQVMNHTSIGGRILEPISAFADIMPIVTEHHEQWDGTGYPDRLVGEDIGIDARILAVADAWDAMTSDRPYRKGCDLEVALTEICNEAGKQFDPRVVEAFLVAMGEDPSRLTARSEQEDLPKAAGGRT